MEVEIMIYKHSINTNITINQLSDLSKLKPFCEEGTLKINKSQIARELGKDRRTVSKYLNGFEKSINRHRISKIDTYHEIIKELLSDKNQQIFYYKKVLWQFLKDNHNLSCAESSFRRYISLQPEFNNYFKKKTKSIIKKLLTAAVDTQDTLQKLHIRNTLLLASNFPKALPQNEIGEFLVDLEIRFFGNRTS